MEKFKELYEDYDNTILKLKIKTLGNFINDGMLILSFFNEMNIATEHVCNLTDALEACKALSFELFKKLHDGSK